MTRAFEQSKQSWGHWNVFKGHAMRVSLHGLWENICKFYVIQRLNFYKTQSKCK